MKNNNLYFIDINFWTKFSLYLHKSYIKGIIATCKSDRIVKIENVIDICEDKLQYDLNIMNVVSNQKKVQKKVKTLIE